MRLSSVVVFLTLSVIEHCVQSEVQDVQGLQGLRTVNPVLAWCFAVSLLSFSGIPPFFGFFGKIAILWCRLWRCGVL
jgi:NADH:ubiquinone oxidoreductase subunit 2 (subunit N)